MRNYLLLLLLLLMAVTSCDSDSDDNLTTEVYVSNEIYIKIENSQGQNLLDTSVVDYFDFSSIKLYYLTDGEKEEVYDANMSLPRNLKLGDVDGEATLIIYTNTDASDFETEEDGVKCGESIAYLELSETVVDTIKTEWEYGGSYFWNTKVWYNGELKSDDNEILITIVH
jgi:hypothetical protein